MWFRYYYFDDAYPKSTFIGFDFDKESIKKAKESAKKENIKNVKFEVSSASEFPGSSYDFVTFFDCLHDMGDPEGALTHLRNVIKTMSIVIVVTGVLA